MEPNSLSDTQPLLSAPTAMPTGNATVIHFGSIQPSPPLFQSAPRKCTGTQTIKP
ncbi:hypothetical protein D3C84_1182930 [compost metagenome]